MQELFWHVSPFHAQCLAGLACSLDRIFKNTFADIEHFLTTCAENGTRFELDCYDIGHLYTLVHFADRGIVKPHFFVQSVFGILGGIRSALGRRNAYEAHGDRLLGREATPKHDAETDAQAIRANVRDGNVAVEVKACPASGCRCAGSGRSGSGLWKTEFRSSDSVTSRPRRFLWRPRLHDQLTRDWISLA